MCLALSRLNRRRRHIRNLALTKKLTDEFCLFFINMAYVPGQFFQYTVLSPCHKRPFSKMVALKACVHDILLTFEWIHSNFIGGSLGISGDLINFW